MAPSTVSPASAIRLAPANDVAVPLTEVRGLKSSEVRPWVALLTSQMIGALVLQIAGRLDFLETGAQALLRMMLAQCLAPAAPKNVKAARKSIQ